MQAVTRLVDILRGYGSTVVAFSGGVDSALVARAAREALGDAAVAVISDSPTLPRHELVEAEATARDIGIRFVALERSELVDPNFVANPTNRCYFCKSGLQEDLLTYASGNGFASVSYGVNLGDLGDWRPGIDGARERGARFPLVEAGLDKAAVRALARDWGLRVWDKPASPCLSSRIPYGEVVTVDKLRRIESAENIVRALGFDDLRVRSIQGTARVEVPEKDLPRLQAFAERVAESLRQLGFRDVVLDPRGLRSGRLNEEHGVTQHA